MAQEQLNVETPVVTKVSKLRPSDIALVAAAGGSGGLLSTSILNYLGNFIDTYKNWPLILPLMLFAGLGGASGSYLIRQERDRKLLPFAFGLAGLTVVLYLLLSPTTDFSLLKLLTALSMFVSIPCIIVGTVMLFTGISRRKLPLAIFASLLLLISAAGLTTAILYDQTLRNREAAPPHYFRAIELFNSSDYTAAIKEYSVAIRLDPYNNYYYEGRAKAYKAVGELDSAIADYTQITKIKPDSSYLELTRADAYAGMAELYAKQGNYEQAVNSYTSAINADSSEHNLNLSSSYAGRGNAYLALGKHDQAFDDYNKAIAAGAIDADAYYGRGLIYKARGEKDKAISDFYRSSELYADSASVQKARAQLRELGVYK